MESSITDTEEIISLFPDKASLYTLLEQELSSDEEQAIILPKTSVEQAKYIAEYLTYSLSCFYIDDVGPVKVSVGISSYPECAYIHSTDL